MSVQNTEGTEDALVVGGDPSAQMAAIFDFLAPGAFDEAPAESPPAGDPAAAGTGQQPPATEGAGGAGVPAGAPAPGDAGVTGVPDAGAPDSGTGAVGSGADGTAGPDAGSGFDASSLKDKWGEISNGFETTQSEFLQQAALAAVQEDFAPYFEHLKMHPRMLVGKEVQAVGREGKERIRDAQDAKDWQDAVKHELAAEIESRVETRREELKPIFETVQSTIALFQNNIDLVPKSKQFDRELADRFAKIAGEYKQVVGDKFIGYSVPMQPIINQLRSQLVAERAAKAPAAPPAQVTPQQQRAAEQPRTPQGTWTGPQAGITSKAGRSGAPEDDAAFGLMDAFMRQNGIRI